MKTAIISFDPNIAEEFKNKLGEANVRVYIDSISMLKEVEEYNPIFIVYDASAGDFAFDDLKFLLSRDKVKDKKFKVLYSKDQPIEDSEILSQNIDIYEKNSELYKVISDILEESKKLHQEEELKLAQELATQQTYEQPETYEFDMSQNLMEETTFQSPESVEEIYSQNMSAEESFESIPDMTIEDLNSEEFKLDDKDFTFSQDESFSEPKEEIEPVIKEPETEEYKSIEKSSFNEEVEPVGSKITLSISKEDIETAVVKLAADKLVENLKEDAEIKEIFENVKLDFVNRVNSELETLKEEIRQEVKNKLFKKVEEELYNKINTELKDYIAEQIALMIKEKINQAFKT